MEISDNLSPGRPPLPRWSSRGSRSVEQEHEKEVTYFVLVQICVASGTNLGKTIYSQVLDKF
jgi:hypothetical protein